MRSRSQGAGAGRFWSEPEPEWHKFVRLRLRTRCRYSEYFFAKFWLQIFEKFQNFKNFSKIEQFQIDSSIDQKTDRNCITKCFLTFCIGRKNFPFRSRNGAGAGVGAETSEPEPEPPNFGPAPHPWLLMASSCWVTSRRLATCRGACRRKQRQVLLTPLDGNTR